MDCDLCVWKKSGVTLNYGRVKYKGLYTQSILNLFITSTRKNAINNVITWCYINWNGNGYHSSSQKKEKKEMDITLLLGNRGYKYTSYFLERKGYNKLDFEYNY